MMKWNFEKVGANDLEQQPHRREFFRDTPRPEAFVREVLQNSLDAKKEDSDKVKVRIAFDRVPLDDIENYLDELKPHLDAWDVMPDEWEPGKNPQVPVLIIEDFGTVGLTGPVSREKTSIGEEDHFLNFWLREGMSEKGGTKGGRWGLGKNTFFMTTEINTFWGLTRRDDDEELLMGKAALKPHTINNERYKYFGFFRNEQSKPITDEQVLRHFKGVFPLIRKKKSGFSIVIPYPVSDINYESVLRSVIMHYFYPILREKLVVKVEDNHGKKNVILNKEKLTQIASRVEWDESNWEDKDVDELMNFALRGVNSLETNDIIQLPDDLGEHKEINKELMGDYFDEVNERFHSGEVVAISIPVSIEPKGSDERWGDFFVFLKQYPPSELSTSDEFYIRSGIRLPEESRRYHRLGKRPIRGMLIIEDDVVSSFLADAEVPAHTHWNEQTEGFSSKYDDSQSTIRYIRNSMRDLAGLLFRSQDERYEGVLQEFFSVVGGESVVPEMPEPNSVDDVPYSSPPPESEEEDEEEEIEDEETTTSSVTSTDSDVPDDIPPSKSRILNITRINKGFKIRFTGDEEHLPLEETLKAAYDVHRGNPFNKYEVFDFDFADLDISGSGFEIEKQAENELKFRAFSSDFEMKVVGFDESRDLIVRI